ncbi:MAG: ferredoxin [Candidatus Pacebacteria bacterium]|jgi:ferredoxin|nr:ferredoxin [Candidatus Paceibacterota bacterium]MDD3072284.1 ferredoxin [Candidatus Paceibacterota bacterium]MDD3728864.1 ferredoxin [Candidatus Paceibacterota bacterium]MDD3728869.1 ferredoxin [Candidatus Paceibacterota bacterium]MDD4201801.1 ferredoxin [Candidatus Paceibacterota bacterium]
MKIILDREKCISCGSCWSNCPRYFQKGDDEKAQLVGKKRVNDKKEEELDIEELSCAKDAADMCPVEIISIVE